MIGGRLWGADPLVEDANATPFGAARVIDLDGIRVAWGRPAKPKHLRCDHKNMVYSSEERRVWCKDCEHTIDAFDAFRVLVDNFRRMESAAAAKMRKADEAMTASVGRRGAKAIDKAWSRDKYAVACVHCRGGLLPEDYADGGATMSRDIEIQRRKNKAKP